jgi:hypothetical protein
VFEAVAETWKTYLSAVGDRWSKDDDRHNLGAEVTNRLRQLDRIIRHLKAAIREVTPDPAEVQRRLAWGAANQPRLTSGEITMKEFIEGTSTKTPDPRGFLDAGDDVWIFTEAFYFSAWRVVVVLRGKDAYKFPALTRVDAHDITIVRNNLIEHPEAKGSRNFTSSLMITAAGPVLRSPGAIVRVATGRVDPLDDSKDQGLFTAAENLRDELQRRFDDAIRRVSPRDR